MKKLALYVGIISVLSIQSQFLFAHCEIPCGIYDDQHRISEISEHAGTVEKSMKKIIELSQEGDKNYNQIVRWVSNKDAHAREIQEIVHHYFMTQRIKPKDVDDGQHAKYVKELKLLHCMLVHAMKCKQTTDTEHVEKLRNLLSEFKSSYLRKKALTNLKVPESNS